MPRKIQTEVPLEDVQDLGSLQQAITDLYAAHAPATARISVKSEKRWSGYGLNERGETVPTALVVTWEV